MADLKKFLDSAGVGHLWGRVVAKIAADVKAEETRAKAEELKNANAASAAQQAADKAQGDVNTLAEKVGTVAEGKTVVDMIEAVQGEVDAVELNVGDVNALQTTNKTVVAAMNELKAAIGTGGTNAVVTIDTTTTTDGALKSYTIKQGGTAVGTIDIPKDMVVESGEVVVNPEGKEAGTYIKLKLANVAEALYINVGTLVDIYVAKADAPQVQVAIDPVTREISATIVAGSVTSVELADNAVVTAKIADANVTKEKLAQDVQTSLGKADSAVQPAALESATDRIKALEDKFGEGEGTVESQIEAALETAAADATAKADAAKEAAIAAAAADATTKANNAQTAAEATAAADATAKANKALEDAKTDATTKANTAESNAKAYADKEINEKIIALTNAEIDTAIGYVG